MDKFSLCESLVDIANQLDKINKTEFADEITKVAESLNKNIKQSQLIDFGKSLFQTPIQIAQGLLQPTQQQNNNANVNPSPAPNIPNVAPETSQQKNIRLQTLNQLVQAGNLDEAMKYVKNPEAIKEYNRLKNAQEFFDSRTYQTKQNIYNEILRELGIQPTGVNPFLTQKNVTPQMMPGSIK